LVVRKRKKEAALEKKTLSTTPTEGEVDGEKRNPPQTPLPKGSPQEVSEGDARTGAVFLFLKKGTTIRNSGREKKVLGQQKI